MVRVRNTLVSIRRKKSNAHASCPLISDHFPRLFHPYHGGTVGGVDLPSPLFVLLKLPVTTAVSASLFLNGIAAISAAIIYFRHYEGLCDIRIWFQWVWLWYCARQGFRASLRYPQSKRWKQMISMKLHNH